MNFSKIKKQLQIVQNRLHIKNYHLHCVKDKEKIKLSFNLRYQEKIIYYQGEILTYLIFVYTFNIKS